MTGDFQADKTHPCGTHHRADYLKYVIYEVSIILEKLLDK